MHVSISFHSCNRFLVSADWYVFKYRPFCAFNSVCPSSFNTNYSTKVQFLGVACKKMVWLSTKKKETTVKILNFCSKFSEICLELFSFSFGNHSGNQLQFRLYPVIPGELWVCPSILFAPRQRPIVTHLISKFEENRRGGVLGDNWSCSFTI